MSLPKATSFRSQRKVCFVGTLFSFLLFCRAFLLRQIVPKCKSESIIHHFILFSGVALESTIFLQKNMPCFHGIFFVLPLTTKLLFEFSLCVTRLLLALVLRLPPVRGERT